MEADTGAHTGQPRHKRLNIVHLSISLTSRTHSGPVGRHKFCKKHKPPHRLRASRERRLRAAILGPGVTSRKEAAAAPAIINATGTSAHCTDGETYAGEMGALGSHFLNHPQRCLLRLAPARTSPLYCRSVCFFSIVFLLLFFFFFHSLQAALHFLVLTHSSN